MKKLFLLLLTVLSVTFTLAQKRKVNGERSVKVASSDIRWFGYKVVKTEPTTHTGFVKLKNGKFHFKNQKVIGGDFVIDMRSLQNTDLEGEDQKKLTDDLKNYYFFDVKKYPIAKFTITKIIPLKNSEYNTEVVGNIIIKGIRKTITFPANIKTNGYSVNFQSAKFSLNRQDFKAFYRSSIRDFIIKDQIDFVVNLSTQ